MPTRPIESYRKDFTARPHKSTRISPHNLQHGSSSFLLCVPQESLTHITSYLPPPSLLALACTCRHLCQHVDDDNTWLRAFLSQFLGISPEHELDNECTLLLRRTEHTWRKEFIFRYAIKLRWECARSPTVTHVPQDSSIDEVHLMSEHGLLTSSIQYGIVARSVPVSGRVLKGYINASGTGLGIGNPNVEFTPDVSACAITSDGGTAHVFWGKRNGEVALTIANRVIDSRAAFNLIRCAVSDQHEGAVQQLVPDSDSNTFLSTGADGRIKLWDTKTLQLLWSTDKQSLVTDPFVSIAGSLSSGFVAGALNSGDILLYDIHQSEVLDDGPRVRSLYRLSIPSPNRNERADESLPPRRPTKMWLYRVEEWTVMLFVQYSHHPQFYRIHADIQSRDVAVTPFGDSSFGTVSVVLPIISTYSLGNNMVISGDLLGFISIYDADKVPPKTAAPVHRFEAHTDGSVTAISWSPTMFATGSARGTTVVWDSLTLEPVRYFTMPAPRPAPGHDWEAVSRILIDNELMIIVVGNRVMTWKVGQTNGRKYQQKKPNHANMKTNVTTRGHRQYEMYRDIAESYIELEYDNTHIQRAFSREHEQRSSLNALGLSELEAVEYVLMLSREEEEARQQRMIIDDQGVFEGDFDDLPGIPTPSRPNSVPLSLLPHGSNGRQYPRVPPPISNKKVQVSPPIVPEPMEAGTSISPLGSLSIGPGSQPSPMTIRSTSSSSLDDFPSLSSSLSSTSSSKQGTSASPGQPRSAWSTPLKSASSLPGPSSPRSRVITPVTRPRPIAPHREVSQVEVPNSKHEEIDDDLMVAIKASLAEARSREGA